MAIHGVAKFQPFSFHVATLAQTYQVARLVGPSLARVKPEWLDMMHRDAGALIHTAVSASATVSLHRRQAQCFPSAPAVALGSANPCRIQASFARSQPRSVAFAVAKFSVVLPINPRFDAKSVFAKEAYQLNPSRPAGICRASHRVARKRIGGPFSCTVLVAPFVIVRHGVCDDAPFSHARFRTESRRRSPVGLDRKRLPADFAEQCDHAPLSTPLEHELASPTMGSGTTGVACINTDRKFIGIEKDATYYAVAQNRMEAAHEGQARQHMDGNRPQRARPDRKRSRDGSANQLTLAPCDGAAAALRGP